MSHIAFIGGIHGVGKSTICQKLCSYMNIEYLSASKILKWNKDNKTSDKKVQDIFSTQTQLITEINSIIKKEKYYLLDGHYVLLSKQNKIVTIPPNTFKEINPFSLNIVIGDIYEIKARLENRDQKQYDYDLLCKMQDMELKHAQYISNTLAIVLRIGYTNDYSNIQEGLKLDIKFV